MTPEQEIKLLKELLYCTKRSCNNCGKVNCENFQRQRIDCCGLWVSYKDYITELENKIADIKANCDLAIEGRDVKIKELEDHLTEEVELHLHAEEYTKSLEEENKTLEGCLLAEQKHTLMLEQLKEKIEVLECDNYNANCNLNLITDHLTKATEIIKSLIALHYNPAVTKDDLKKQDKILEQAEQFVKEIEK